MVITFFKYPPVIWFYFGFEHTNRPILFQTKVKWQLGLWVTFFGQQDGLIKDAQISLIYGIKSESI